MFYEKEDINTAVLRKLQLVQQEILDEIVRICNKNDLKYYLVGGTLLGAVRHKGFIPWDDDLDIAMPRYDYDKFIEICKTQLGEQYYLHSFETDDKYWLIFAKLRKKNTVLNERNIAHLDVPKGIYVDIFPFDNAVNPNSFSQKIKTKIIKSLYSIIVSKVGVIVKKERASKFVAGLFKFVSIKRLSVLANKLMRNKNKKETKYYINYGSNYNTVKQTIPKDKYEPAKNLEFEGKLYRVPNDYDYVLRQIYNDYLILPPIEKQTFRHKPDFIDFGD